MNNKLRAYLLISLLAVCWGSIPLIIKTADVSSMSLVGIRTFLGAIFLLVFVLQKRQITKDLLYSGIFLGPLLAIHWSTMFKSIELNTVAVGIGLVFSYPIFILIIELLLGKNIRLFQASLVFMGFFGLYLLLDFSSISSLLGVVYGLVSAFSLAILIIYGSSKSIQFGGLNVAFVQISFAAIILSPFTYNGFYWMLDNLIISMFLGFFLTGIGLTTYWYAIKFIPPVSIGTITFLEPVTGVIFGAIILNESLRVTQYVGFTIVLLIGITQVILDTKNRVQSYEN